MALNSRSGIDPRWISHNLRSELALHFANIEIYNNITISDVYDPTTNTWENNQTLTWVGTARIQPRSTVGLNGANSQIDPASNNIVDIFIGLRENQLAGSNGELPDLRPGDRVVVTSAIFNPSLVNFDYIVRGVINSSNPWNRHLVCEVNQELNPNNG